MFEIGNYVEFVTEDTLNGERGEVTSVYPTGYRRIAVMVENEFGEFVHPVLWFDVDELRKVEQA